METEDELLEFEEEGFTLEEEKPPIFDKIRKYLGYFLAGLLSFILGMWLFFPSKRFSSYVLQKIQNYGIPVNVDDSHISLGGEFEFNNIRYQDNSSGEEIQFKAGYLNGDVSLWQYLIQDKISMTYSALALAADLGSNGKFTGGTWEGSLEIEGLNKPVSQMSGAGSDKQTDAKFNIMVLQKEIEIRILTALYTWQLKNGQLVFNNSQMQTDVGTVKLQGSVSLGGRAMLNLQIIITPNDTFYGKSDFLNKEYLQTNGYLNPKGEIEILLNGPLNRPSIKVQQTTPQAAILGGP